MNKAGFKKQSKSSLNADSPYSIIEEGGALIEKAVSAVLPDVVRSLIEKGVTTVSVTEENIARILNEAVLPNTIASGLIDWFRSLGQEERGELVTLFVRELVKLPLQFRIDELLLEVLSKVRMQISLDFELKRDHLQKVQDRKKTAVQKIARQKEIAKLKNKILMVIRQQESGLTAAEIAQKIECQRQRVVYYAHELIAAGQLTKKNKTYFLLN